MPFARKDFDELQRQLALYRAEVGESTAAVDVTTTDGQRLCVLKVVDVTENTVTFLIYDEQVGIDALSGREKSRRKTAVLLPHDGIRSIVFGPTRADDLRAEFGAAT
jgi:hypothetical protein